MLVDTTITVAAIIAFLIVVIAIEWFGDWNKWL